MKKFTEAIEMRIIPDDTSKHHVNYLRFVTMRKSSDSYFDLIKDEDEMYDREILEGEYGAISISPVKIKADYGDKLYVILKYAETFTSEISIVYAFKDPIEAVKNALTDFNNDKGNEKIVKVIEIKVEPYLCIGTPRVDNIGKFNVNEQFNREDTIFSAVKSKRESLEEITINPKVGQDDEIKNILLSMQSINKFKL